VPGVRSLTACAPAAVALTLTLALTASACSPNSGSSASGAAVVGQPQAVLAGRRDPTSTASTAASTTTSSPPTTVPAPTTTTAAISDARIFIMGDSVMAAMNPNYTDEARKVLTPRGWKVTIDAKESRFPLAGLHVLQARRAEIGQVVVIQMANNYGGNEQIWGQQIDQMFAALAGVPKVVFLTVGEFRPDRRQVNAELRAALARHPNMVLADWNAVASRDSSLLAGDGLHLTGKGAQAIATLIAATVGNAPGSTAPVPPAPPSA